jgi:hypothetical protein
MSWFSTDGDDESGGTTGKMAGSRALHDGKGQFPVANSEWNPTIAGHGVK